MFYELKYYIFLNDLNKLPTPTTNINKCNWAVNKLKRY